MKFKLNRLEQYSRKSSIRVYGIEEEEGERVGEQVIKKIKEEIDIEVTPEETDIVHRVRKKSVERSRGSLVKFIAHKSKEKVMRKKKETLSIRISEDLSNGTRKMLNEIYEKKQVSGIDKAWTIDGRIKYKYVNSDRILEIPSADDYNKLCSSVNMEQ